MFTAPKIFFQLVLSLFLVGSKLSIQPEDFSDLGWSDVNKDNT